MTEETIKALDEFRASIIRELDEYCRTIAKAADVQLKYEKRHPDEARCAPASMSNLWMYYGYNGARDVVNEVFNEFMSRPEGRADKDYKN